MADIQRKQARMVYKSGRTISNVNISQRVIQGITIECLVAEGDSDRKFEKVIADGRAETSIIGTGWLHSYENRNAFCPLFPNAC